MKPVNIYALTRIKDRNDLERLERQMSGRSTYLRIREWETDGLGAFIGELEKHCKKAYELEFFYAVTMQKLGKEFDLLRINDEYIVNIEIKSREVTNEAILKQLLMNRYYLSTLGRNVYYYTFISDTGRLLRLSNSGKIAEADWDELGALLEKQNDCYTGDIDELFKEDRYLISPITDPGRFLRGEYFLTNQQNDIKHQILRKIAAFKADPDRDMLIQGFTGLPGTGKTLLLFDIGMQLSKNDKVCVFHMGSHERELEQLDERLKRIDFYYFADKERLRDIERYSAILVDEGHRTSKEDIDHILALAKEWAAPVVFSYDKEEPVAPSERADSGYVYIEALEGFSGYKLTNRIRLNIELSTFIKCVMCAANKGRRREYPNVSVVFGKGKEAEKLIESFMDQGYVYIYDETVKQPTGGLVFKGGSEALSSAECVEVRDASCKEFDKIVMLLDDSFSYDKSGFLRNRDAVRKTRKTAEGRPDDAAAESAKEKENHAEELSDTKDSDRRVRNLFHGLSRAKENIALVVRDNKKVFEVLLFTLQGLRPGQKVPK